MSRRGIGLFVAMAVIWGVPYLLIKVAVRDIGPAALVGSRTAIGALVLVPVAAARHELRPVLARWRPLLAYTVAEMAVPWVLISHAEQRLPSSLTGLLVAAVPLVGVALGLALGRHEPLGARGVAGLVVGLAGVVVLLGLDVSGTDVGSAALVAFVVVGYAVGPAIVARSLHDVPALGVAAASLLVCAVVYLPWTVTGLPAHLPGRVTASVLTLGVVCTALAFVLFFALIAEVGPVRATVITYANPAVAVVLGAAFLHESVGVGTALGFGLVIVGSVLATRRVAVARGPRLHPR